MKKAISDQQRFKTFMLHLTLTQSPRHGNVLNLLDSIEDFLHAVMEQEFTEEDAQMIWYEMLQELVNARNKLVQESHPYNGFLGILESIFDMHMQRQRMLESGDDCEKCTEFIFPANEFTSTSVALVRALIEVSRFYAEQYSMVEDDVQINWESEGNEGGD